MIVLAVVVVHLIVSGSERYTSQELNRVPMGSSLAQVEAILGPPTDETQYANGVVAAAWENSDHSYDLVNVRNGVVDLTSYAGPGDVLVESARARLGVWGLNAALAVLAAVVIGLCLFIAARIFGYSITVTQVAIFAVVTALLRMLPAIGWLLALGAGAALVERWGSAGWWKATLITCVAVVAAGLATLVVFGMGSGLGTAL